VLKHFTAPRTVGCRSWSHLGMGNCASSGKARREEQLVEQQRKEKDVPNGQAGEQSPASCCHPKRISCDMSFKPGVKISATNGGPPWRNATGGWSNAASRKNSASEQAVLLSDAARRPSIADRTDSQQHQAAVSQRIGSGEYWSVGIKQTTANGVPSKTSSFRTQTSSTASAPSIRLGSSEEQPSDTNPGALMVPIPNCPPLPPNNELRLATIETMSFMEATPCAELGLLLNVICKCWEAPVACVTLLGARDVWMSNCVCNGLPTDDKLVPWEVAMCPWTLLPPHPMAMAVNDLGCDARFSGNKHHKAGTQSYLTSPLVASNGHRVGAICIMDQNPRMFAAADCRLMNNFAELAVRELERHARLVDRLKQDSTEGSSTRISVSLAQAFSRYVRNVEDAADSCMMLVDTRVEGWKVLYCGVTWKEWTGVDRELCQGCTLDELLELAHGNPQARVTADHMHDAINMKAFVTPKVRIRASVLPPSAASAKPLRFSFYLSMRPAALDPLDANTLPIGIPSSVPIDGNKHLESAFYFVRVHAVPDPPNNSGVTNLARSTCMSMDHHHRVPRRRPELSLGPLVAAQQLFPSLVPRQILGRGQLGTVFHARWKDGHAALKVTDHQVSSALEQERAEMEVRTAARLVHPNIVKVLAHAKQLLGINTTAHGYNSLESTHSACTEYDSFKLHRSTNAFSRDSSTIRARASDASTDMFSGQDGELQFLPLCHAGLAEARTSNHASSLSCSVPKPLSPILSFRHFHGLAACSDFVPSGCQSLVDGTSIPGSGSFAFARQPPSTNPNSNQQISSADCSPALDHQSNVQERQPSFLLNLGRRQMETLDEEPCSFPSDRVSNFTLAKDKWVEPEAQAKPRMECSSSVWADQHHQPEDFYATRALSDPLKPHTMEFEEHWQKAGLEMQAHGSNPIMEAVGKGLLHIGQLPEYRGPMWHPIDASSIRLAKPSPEVAQGSQPISKDSKESMPERATAAVAATELPRLDAVLSDSSSVNATTRRSFAGTISAPLPTIATNGMQVCDEVEHEEEEGSKHGSGQPNSRHCIRCISLQRGMGEGSSSFSSGPAQDPSMAPTSFAEKHPHASPTDPLACAHSNLPANPAKSGAPRSLLRQHSATLSGQYARRRSAQPSQRRVSFRNLPPSPTFVSMPAAGMAKPSERSETGNEALFPYFTSQNREGDAGLLAGPASGSSSKLPMPSTATNSPSPRSHSPTNSSDAFFLYGRQASSKGTQGDGAESKAGSLRHGRSLFPFAVRRIDSQDLQQGGRSSRSRSRRPRVRSRDFPILFRDTPQGMPFRTSSGLTEASYITRSSSRATLNTQRSSRSTPGSKSVLARRTSGEPSEQCGRLLAAATEGCALPGSPDAHAGNNMPSKFPYRLRQWLLLEFCDRGNLADAIDQGWLRMEPRASAPLCLPMVWACARDVARGLAYLHAHCVLHGDLTAENVLLQSVDAEPLDLRSLGTGGLQGATRGRHSFVAKISDFTKGRSLPLEDAQQCITTGSYSTIDHLAPEVISDQRVSYKGDIYSLGIILWRMLTGSRPWCGLSHQQVVEAVCKQGQRLGFPRGMQDGLGLQDLALRCMAHDPDERPSAADVLAELEAKDEMS